MYCPHQGDIVLVIIVIITVIIIVIIVAGSGRKKDKSCKTIKCIALIKEILF